VRRTRRRFAVSADAGGGLARGECGLMLDLGMLAVAAACFAVIVAILYGLDRI
jgi:hypothetical protein